MLDQTRLPDVEAVLELRSAEATAQAIERLCIRGAPLIGVAAAYGVALELARGGELDAACARLIASRPTAVNLRWAVEQVRAAVRAAPASAGQDVALRAAVELHAREERASAAIAHHGADALGGARRVLTHCNTGALAAPGAGTALAVIVELHRRGQLHGVIATETRPLLQGARLTVYELRRHGIPHELIVDSAAAGLITGGELDAVIVGCDRVAANGDVANKVGTLGLALAARAAGLPCFVAGPTSTIDFDTPTGSEIPIEARDPDEVRRPAGAPEDTPVRNPAFDVTPAALIAGLITEAGVARPVNARTIAALGH